VLAQLRLELELRDEFPAQVAPENAAPVDEKQRRRQEQALDPAETIRQGEGEILA